MGDGISDGLWDVRRSYAAERRQVRVQRVRDVPLPEYHTPGAAAFDLALAVDVTIHPRLTVMAPTGLVIGAPEGTMLMVVPRSSTRKKYGLHLGNTVGIIDSDYCGPEDEIMLALRSENYSKIEIPAGTRLAQGIIVPIVRAEFLEVDQVTENSRGGWGSTGD